MHDLIQWESIYMSLKEHIADLEKTAMHLQLVDRLKPYVSHRDGTNAPLHDYSESEGFIETDSYLPPKL